MERQNSAENLSRLAAQRYLYSHAKMLILLQYLGVTTVSVMGVFAALKIGISVSVASVIFTILDAFLVERFIRSRLKEAALIQEDFDCNVLNFEWSKTKCGARVPMEEVHLFARRMSSTVRDQKLRNWYPKSAFALPEHIGRIICQRANVVWNLSGRKRVALGLDTLGVMSVVALIASLFLLDFETGKWCYTALIPMLPFLNRLRDVWFRTRDSVARANHLQSRICEIWSDAISGRLSAGKLTERSREFQNELFDFRSREIPVFDWLYWRLRKSSEKGMNQTAESMVNETRGQLSVEGAPTLPVSP